MDIEQLNKLIESSADPKLSKFDSDGISSTLLPQGDYLYMSIGEGSVMLYMSCENIGEKSVVNPEVFERLLSLNMFGGRYHNIRLTYDSDTAVLWLCYDVMFDTFSPETFKSSVKTFIEEGNSFRSFLNENILNIILAENSVSSKAAVENKSTVSSASPSSSSVQETPSRTYTAFDEPDRPVDNAATEILQGRSEIPETEEDGMISVMIAQSMFMMA